MKKLITLICAGVIAASIAGCSGEADVNNTASEEKPQVTEQQKEPETQTASEEIEESTEQNTEQAE